MEINSKNNTLYYAANIKLQQTVIGKFNKPEKRSNSPTYIMQMMGLIDKSIPNSPYVNNKFGVEGMGK